MSCLATCRACLALVTTEHQLQSDDGFLGSNGIWQQLSVWAFGCLAASSEAAVLTGSNTPATCVQLDHRATLMDGAQNK